MLHGFARTALLASGIVLVQLLAQQASRAEGPALTILEWSGYEDPNLHVDYTAKHGEPAFTFFGSEDEAFQKLRLGFKADLSHPCSNNVAIWRDAGLLQPLDTSRIKGWNDILPDIRNVKNLMTDDKGQAWFLPFDWGNTLLTYRTDKVTADEAKSLKIFTDPKLKDRIAIPDNADAAYALGLVAVGVHDLQKVTDEDFRKASDFLRQVHKNVRMYWNDPTELSQAITGGEVDVAWAWNETAVKLKAQGVPVEMKKDTEEGLASWVCGYVYLKDSPADPQAVYDFLSAANAPAVSSYMVNAWGYGHANGAGMAAVDKAVLDKTGYGDMEKFVDKTMFAAPMSGDLKMKQATEFEKIKAGY